MFGVLPVHPRYRNRMDVFPLSSPDTPDMMESMMEMMDNWGDRGWMMKPHSCSNCHGRGYHLAATPVRRPLVECRPFNLSSLISSLEPSAEQGTLRNKGDRDQNKHSHRNRPKERGNTQQVDEGRGSGGARSKGQDADKPWQYSVDVGGCDEVRTYTESGMVMVEGRGRSGDSSMKVLYMTKLPPTIKTDTLTATLKQDGHLVLSQPSSDGATAGVTNISITTDQQQSTELQKASNSE